MVSEQVETDSAPRVMPMEDAPPSEAAAPPTVPAATSEREDQRRLAAVWAAAVVAFALFVGVASLPREAGSVGGRLRMARAWSLLAGELPDGTSVQLYFWAAVAVSLFAAGLGLWLALTAGPTAGDPSSDGRSDLA